MVDSFAKGPRLIQTAFIFTMSNSMISAPGVREAALVRVAPVGRFLILKDSTRKVPYSQSTYPQVLIFSVDKIRFSVDNFRTK